MARPVPTQQTRKGPKQKNIPKVPPVVPGTPATVDIAGDPKNQCYKFVINDKLIQGDWKASIDRAGSDCVMLVTSAVAVGSALFIVCCQKDDHGKCKDCTSTFKLQVSQDIPGVGPVTRISQDATITCVP